MGSLEAWPMEAGPTIETHSSPSSLILPALDLLMASLGNSTLLKQGPSLLHGVGSRRETWGSVSAPHHWLLLDEPFFLDALFYIQVPPVMPSALARLPLTV